MSQSREAVQSSSSPKFRSPPVVETALGIQFHELTEFNSTHFGHFHQMIRDRYPIAEDQPRLAPIIETFPRMDSLPQFSIRSVPRVERVWFKDPKDSSRLMQLQPDRFGFNWKKGSDEEQYPSYTKNSQLFLDEFRTFITFCEQHGWDVQPNLCEVVYVNHIKPIEGESVIDLFASIFPGINWETSDNWMPSCNPEIATLNRVFEIPDQQGRLYVEAGIAHDKERGNFLNLRVIARTLHSSNDPSDIQETLKLAHDWVVNGFVSLTDATVRQKRWGQVND